MVYADTDFFLAILKESDWLKSGAAAVLEKHKGSIRTSVITFVELALVMRGTPVDLERLFSGALEIAACKDEDAVVLAAHYLKSGKVTVFDAFHAALSANESIVSSDSVYDKLGLKRIPMEKGK